MFNPGEVVTPLYELYRHVPTQRVWFLNCFGLKIAHRFCHFGMKLEIGLSSALKLGVVFKETA